MSSNQEKPNQTSIKFRTYIIAILIVLVGIYGIYRLVARNTISPYSETEVQSLAQCLTEHGVKMYGIFTCSHCKNQKESFGKAFELIDYTECTKDGRVYLKNPECVKLGIGSFPTWTFSDGTRHVGEMSFADLAKQAGCPWEESVNKEDGGLTLLDADLEEAEPSKIPVPGTFGKVPGIGSR